MEVQAVLNLKCVIRNNLSFFRVSRRQRSSQRQQRNMLEAGSPRPEQQVASLLRENLLDFTGVTPR